MHWSAPKTAVLLSTLSVASGCFHWVPIEPTRYEDGRPHNFSVMRVGTPEAGQVIDHAQINYPMLFGTQGGQPVSYDLRQTPAQQRKLTPGSVAGIVIGSVLGGLVITGGLILLFGASAPVYVG